MATSLFVPVQSVCAMFQLAAAKFSSGRTCTWSGKSYGCDSVCRWIELAQDLLDCTAVMSVIYCY